MEAMDETGTDACYRCGYNLTGIADNQACPECGLLAERSRRVTDELHQTRPRWLRRLSRGVWLILLAVLLPFPLGYAVSQADDWLIRSLTNGRMMYGSWAYLLTGHLHLLALDVPVVLLTAGVLLLTSRERYPPADRGDARLRRALRAALLIPWAALALLHTLLHLAYTGRALSMLDRGLLRHAELVILAPITLGSIPLVVLLALRLRALARRARSAHLAEHCLIVGIGTASTLAYAFAVAVVMEFAESWGWGANWTNNATASLVVAGVLAVLGALFVLWALYLLVRFAVAFGLAARRLRREGRRDDRSTGTLVGPAALS
jgi:hypothetical protein